jgi:hypothetical protein
MVGPAEPLTEDRDGSVFTASGDREYVQKYRVKSFYKSISKDDVCRAVGIPLPWSVYTPFSPVLKADLAALLVETSATPQVKDDWQYWIVTCRYSTRVPEEGPPKAPNVTKHGHEPDGTQNQPWKKRARIEWDYEVINEAFPKDLAGVPYVDTVGIPINPPPTRPVACQVLLVRKNFQTFNPKQYAKWGFAINSGLWCGFDPKTVKCYPVKPKLEWLGKIPFWEVHMKFVFLPDIITGAGRDRTWQTSILMRGGYEKKAINGGAEEPWPIFMQGKSGLRATTPQLLDELGHVTTAATPYYKPFRDYQELDFNLLLNESEVLDAAVYP